MKFMGRTVLCATLAILATVSVTSAVTIHDVMRQDFDPSVLNVLWFYGGGGHYLTWDKIDSGTGLFDPTGSAGTTGTWEGNPAWLDFHLNSIGGGSNGPFGPGSNQVSYTLATTGSSPSSFDFSVLFYDPDYDASVGDATTIAQVVLTGSNGTVVDSTGGNEALVTAGEARGGIMLTWTVDADTAEDVTITINSLGLFAAGFFLDNISGGTPEPATLGLVAVGLAGMLLRRRR